MTPQPNKSMMRPHPGAGNSTERLTRESEIERHPALYTPSPRSQWAKAGHSETEKAAARTWGRPRRCESGDLSKCTETPHLRDWRQKFPNPWQKNGCRTHWVRQFFCLFGCPVCLPAGPIPLGFPLQIETDARARSPGARPSEFPGDMASGTATSPGLFICCRLYGEICTKELETQRIHVYNKITWDK